MYRSNQNNNRRLGDVYIPMYLSETHPLIVWLHQGWGSIHQQPLLKKRDIGACIGEFNRIIFIRCFIA